MSSTDEAKADAAAAYVVVSEPTDVPEPYQHGDDGGDEAGSKSGDDADDAGDDDAESKSSHISMDSVADEEDLAVRRVAEALPVAARLPQLPALYTRVRPRHRRTQP